MHKVKSLIPGGITPSRYPEDMAKVNNNAIEGFELLCTNPEAYPIQFDVLFTIC